MTLIDELNRSISQLSNDELLERIKELRAARRVYTPIPRGKPKAPTGKTKLDLAAMVESLSVDEIQTLLNELQQED